MKRELGIARCGLACCLCSENDHCGGCNSGMCPDVTFCENRRCSAEKEIAGCWACDNRDCRCGLLQKIKPRAFSEFVRRYGLEMLLDCLEENEKNGVVYHRAGIRGDYDEFDDTESLLAFIRTGKRETGRTEL